MSHPDMSHLERWPHLPLRAGDLVLILALTLGAILLLGLVISGLTLSAGLVVAILVLQSTLVLGAIYLVAIGIRGASLEQLGLRSAPRRWYLRAVEVALLTLPLVWLVNAAVQAFAGTPFRNPQIDLIAPGGFSWLSLVGMTFVTGIVAPVAEEIAFRGVLYGWLRQRFGVPFGVVASALLFSVAHGIPTLIPALAVQGIVLALLYERSRSLWTPIITHGTYNATTVILLYAALASGVAPT